MATTDDHAEPRDWSRPGPTTGIVVQEFVTIDGVMQAPGDPTGIAILTYRPAAPAGE